MNLLSRFLFMALLGLMTAGCSQKKSSAEKPLKLTVMSYNIRYDNPDDGINAWDNRKKRVGNLLQFYQPDFIGIQEGLLHQVKYLDDKLKSYRWIGVGRQDGTMSGEFSALFYDSTKVELVPGSEKTIWLSKTPSEPSKSWDAALPRIVTYGQFRSKANNRKFFVFNTHFDHIGDTARVKSAQLILDRISEVAADKAVILTGDFNATPDSKPYSILTSGDQKLRDAYTVSQVPNVGPLFTYEGFSVQSKKQKRRIDYIFVNNKVQVKKHAIISSFKDARYPSDHLPVIAEMVLWPKDDPTE